MSTVLKKNDDGTYEMRDWDDRLKVGTGDEAEQAWPVKPMPEEVMPLLDFDVAWKCIAAGEEKLPSKKKVDGTVNEANAKIIVKEIGYHLLASTTLLPVEKEGNTTEEVKEEDKDDDSGLNFAPLPKEDDEKVKSIYGASLLLKLQWEDRSPQKDVPHRTYEELGHFMAAQLEYLKKLHNDNSEAAKTVIDLIADELSLALWTRYMDGIETETSALEDSIYAYLTFLADHATPKRMHMPLRLLLKKVDKVYMEATSYLVMKPLMEVWMKVVLRIERRRQYFVKDLLGEWDHLLRLAEAYELSMVDDDTGGVAKPGRIKGVWDMMLSFLESLLKLQHQQKVAEGSVIQVEVDELGRERVASASVNEEKKTGEEGEGDDDKAKQVSEETLDWVNERMMVLARALQLQSALWSALGEPGGEERSKPGRRGKPKSKRVRMEREKAESDLRHEVDMVRMVRLIRELGWSNPVLACQVGAVGVRMETVTMEDELRKEHLGVDTRKKKDKKHTVYGVRGVAQFVCGCLRTKTRIRLGELDESVDEYEVKIDGSGFEYLTPEYGFDLILPYILTMIGESSVPIRMAGVTTAAAFLKRIASFKTFDEVMRSRSGTDCMGQEVNIRGLAQQLSRALEGCDDPRHRRFTYQTLQLALKKIDDASARYTVAEGLWLECKRIAVAAQLVTEMKDALRYVESRQQEDANGFERSSRLKSRFVEAVLPKYLMPRKESLMTVNCLVAVCNSMAWVCGSDARLLKQHGTELGNDVMAETERRRRMCKEYSKLGRQCIRALASVAEHDRKNLPTSKLAKKDVKQAEAVFAASGRSLNMCMGALTSLDLADELLAG